MSRMSIFLKNSVAKIKHRKPKIQETLSLCKMGDFSPTIFEIEVLQAHLLCHLMKKTLSKELGHFWKIFCSVILHWNFLAPLMEVRNMASSCFQKRSWKVRLGTFGSFQKLKYLTPSLRILHKTSEIWKF